MTSDCLIGIDEVGRGPLAGPVAVCAFSVKATDAHLLRSIRDSKQLPKAAREEWFEQLSNNAARGRLDYAVSFVTPARIDRIGIVAATHSALVRSLAKVTPDPRRVRVLLDGGLRAPEEFYNQQTIIKGDTKEPVIAAASIIAKVLRDRRMTRYGKQYPEYGFEQHKGYGTREHRNALRKHGPCVLHRRTFLNY